MLAVLEIALKTVQTELILIIWMTIFHSTIEYYIMVYEHSLLWYKTPLLPWLIKCLRTTTISFNWIS